RRRAGLATERRPDRQRRRQSTWLPDPRLHDERHRPTVERERVDFGGRYAVRVLRRQAAQVLEHGRPEQVLQRAGRHVIVIPERGPGGIPPGPRSVERMSADPPAPGEDRRGPAGDEQSEPDQDQRRYRRTRARPPTAATGTAGG